MASRGHCDFFQAQPGACRLWSWSGGFWAPVGRGPSSRRPQLESWPSRQGKETALRRSETQRQHGRASTGSESLDGGASAVKTTQKPRHTSSHRSPRQTTVWFLCHLHPLPGERSYTGSTLSPQVTWGPWCISCLSGRGPCSSDVW